MAKKNGDGVEVVITSSCNIDGRLCRVGEIVTLSQRDAADMKALRMARDVLPTDGGRVVRGRYDRRDMQARS